MSEMQPNSPRHLDFGRRKNDGNPMLRIPQPTEPRLPKVHPNRNPTKAPEKHSFPRRNLTTYTSLRSCIKCSAGKMRKSRMFKINSTLTAMLNLLPEQDDFVFPVKNATEPSKQL